MMLEVARFVNLVLAGLLAGNEFGTKVAIHPSPLSGVRTDNTPKVRFSAAVSQEPEIELALV